MTRIPSASIAIMILALAGCGGGGSQTTNVMRSTTIGQELQDLQTAHEKGALTDKEYAAQKEKLLSGKN